MTTQSYQANGSEKEETMKITGSALSEALKF